MKIRSWLLITSIVMVIGFSVAACEMGPTGDEININSDDTGSSGDTGAQQDIPDSDTKENTHSTNHVSTVLLSGDNEYVSVLFDPDSIINVNITISSENRTWMNANSQKEEYVSGDIEVGGYAVSNIGIRPKGNSTLKAIASSTSNRYSFKVKFNEYVKGQKLLGMKKLILNSCYQDKTFIKEYMSYYLMKELGIPTPAFTFCRLYFNGEYWGLYFMLEDVGESFVERYYGSNIQYAVYKPEPEGNFNSTSTGGALVYNGNAANYYKTIFDNTVCTSADDDTYWENVIEMTRVLNSGQNMDSILNTDEIIRYIAAQDYMVNLDSYLGQMYHNYYLIEINGIFQIIPWDYNLSFAGFSVQSASNAVNFPIDKPYTGNSAADFPLISKILTGTNLEKYHGYLQFLADYSTANFAVVTDKVIALIDSHINTDPTKFYTYAEFTQGVSTLKQFVSDRNKSIYAQLAGTQSSTSYGNITTSVNLSDMGGGGGNQPGGANRPGGGRP